MLATTITTNMTQKMIKTTFISTFRLLALLCLTMASQSIAGNINVFTGGNNIALEGYDLVSYFKGAPQKGKSSLYSDHKGVEYRFANEINREQFVANPDAYLPQYGGHCAYSVRMGQKMPSDATSYMIIDDKLYMLFNRATKEVWQRSPEKNIRIADGLWPSIVEQEKNDTPVDVFGF